MKFAIFYNPKTNPENKKHALETAEILKKQKISFLLNPSEKDMGKIDIALAVGGDGTVLYTANLLAKTDIPILGINFGHRGYLCNANKNKIGEAIDRIFENNYRISRKTRIQAEIKRQNDEIKKLEALNEISVGGINRTVYIDTKIITPERSVQSKIIGDGLIVSTRTGSTAYNINAGGPMLLTEAFNIVANNAFFQSEYLLPITRSLVVPPETVIEIRDFRHDATNLPYVIADGQKSVKISKTDSVIIKKSDKDSLFVTF